MTYKINRQQLAIRFPQKMMQGGNLARGTHKHNRLTFRQQTLYLSKAMPHHALYIFATTVLRDIPHFVRSMVLNSP